MIKRVQTQVIVEKLNSGIKFGLYNNGKVCYFDDGTYVSYNELWTALRIVNNLDISHKKTLFELCPDTYRGVFPYGYSRVRLLNIIRGYLAGTAGLTK